MRGEELVVQVRADIADAQRGFQAVGQSAERFRTQAQGAAGAAATLGASSRSSAGFAIDLGRALNDSQQFAYGFTQGLIATSNQLDGLVMGFRQMQAQAQASGRSLRTVLVASMMGPGGLLVAINAIATAAVVLGPAIADAFTEGAEGADRAREAFDDALDALLKFQFASRSFTVQNRQQAEALLAASTAERDAAAQRREALEGEREALRRRVSGGGQYTSAGLTPQESARLSALPGLIRQAGEAFNEYAGYVGRAEAAVARYRAEEQILSRLPALGVLETPDRERGGPAAGGRRGGAAGVRAAAMEAARSVGDVTAAVDADLAVLAGQFREGLINPLALAADTADALRDAVTQAFRVSGGETTAGVTALITKLREAEAMAARLGSVAPVSGRGPAPLGGASDPAGAVRDVGAAAVQTVDGVGAALSAALSDGIVGGVGDLSRLLGEMAVLDFSGLRSLGDIFRGIAADIAAATARILIFRGLAALFGGVGTPLGGVFAAAGGFASAAGGGGALKAGGEAYNAGGYLRVPHHAVRGATRGADALAYAAGQRGGY